MSRRASATAGSANVTNTLNIRHMPNICYLGATAHACSIASRDLGHVALHSSTGMITTGLAGASVGPSYTLVEGVHPEMLVRLRSAKRCMRIRPSIAWLWYTFRFSALRTLLTNIAHESTRACRNRPERPTRKSTPMYSAACLGSWAHSSGMLTQSGLDAKIYRYKDER